MVLVGSWLVVGRVDGDEEMESFTCVIIRIFLAW